MKRSNIIKRIEEVAKSITTECRVFTNEMEYPKCQLCKVSEYIGGYARPGKALTPYLLPMELLAYVQGMKAAQGKQY